VHYGTSNKVLLITTTGFVASPPVKAMFVKCAGSSSESQNGVSSLVISKEICIVGFRAAVASVGITQSGLSLIVNVDYLDSISNFK